VEQLSGKKKRKISFSFPFYLLTQSLVNIFLREEKEFDHVREHVNNILKRKICGKGKRMK